MINRRIHKSEIALNMKSVEVHGESNHTSWWEGTRLWPLSRERFPKQFLKLIDGKSLLECAYRRAIALADAQDVVTVTSADFLYLTEEIAESVDPKLTESIIAEPVGKNTAPAVGLAVKYISEKLQGLLMSHY